MASPIRKEVIIGDCRLLLGDCLEILPTLGKVDAVVTDPPYRLNKSARRDEGRGSGKRNKTLTTLCERGIHNGFNIKSIPDAENTIIFCAKLQLPEILNFYWPKYSDRWMLITWHKSHSQHLSGSYAPDTEYIVHLWKSGKLAKRGFPRFYFGSHKHLTAHPAEKPVWLMEPLVKVTNGLVCDPYMGSGSTGVACANLGRPFVGIEADKEYFDIACERIRKAYAQPDMFVPQPVRDPGKQSDMFGGQAA